jgi:hypothetical protein
MNLTEEQRRKINQFIAEKCGLAQSSLSSQDYTRSIDSCHTAEMLMGDDDRDRMASVIGRHDTRLLLHATAEQRALALFTTLGGQL